MQRSQTLRASSWSPVWGKLRMPLTRGSVSTSFQKTGRLFYLHIYQALQFFIQASRCVHSASTVRGGQALVDGGTGWDRAHVRSEQIIWKNAHSFFFRYAHTPGGKPSNANQTFLDESGFSFVQDCLAGLENRGLEDQGMYRVVGVGSKVTIGRREVKHNMHYKTIQIWTLK